MVYKGRGRRNKVTYLVGQVTGEGMDTCLVYQGTREGQTLT